MSPPLPLLRNRKDLKCENVPTAASATINNYYYSNMERQQKLNRRSALVICALSRVIGFVFGLLIVVMFLGKNDRTGSDKINKQSRNSWFKSIKYIPNNTAAPQLLKEKTTLLTREVNITTTNRHKYLKSQSSSPYYDNGSNMTLLNDDLVSNHTL